MLKNYLKIALRNLLKHKAYSFINIAGLAIGAACCWLILLFIYDELSYDRHHKNAGRICRLITINKRYPEFSHTATETKLAGKLIDEMPGVTAGARLKPSGGLVRHGDKRYNEERFFFADPGVFEVFTLPLLAGDSRTALAQPNAVVITQETAGKYFGAENPLGKILTLDDTLHFKITGILKNLPRNSHCKFDFLASLIGAEKRFETVLTYFLLDANIPAGEAEKSVAALYKKLEPEAHLENFPLCLQPLTAIHFYSHLQGEIEPNGEIAYIYIFSAVAIFVLLIACFNFMNLAAARSAQRAKEVGLRKVIGANRQQLLAQFMGESVILSLAAIGLALALVECALPWFNALVGKELAIRYNEHWLILAGVALFAGAGAGFYPAILVSRFQPAQIFKGRLNFQRGGYALRRGLIVAQFAISVMMIIAAIAIHRQLVYVREKPLGFNKGQVAVLNIRDSKTQRKSGAFKNALLRHSHISHAAVSSTVPGKTGEKFLPHWHYRLPGTEDSHEHGHAQEHVNTLFVDGDFLATMEIELAAGRNFSSSYPTDLTEALIINEAAMRKFEWESPAIAVGKEIKCAEMNNKNLVVVGVTKTFHYASLHNNIEPLMIRLVDPEASSSSGHGLEQMVISVRVSSNDIPATMAFIADKWQAFDANHPLECFFLDENFDKLYQADQRLGKVFGYFSVLAIFIACMGLFGLAAFTAEQRTREIGIRKVLGASVAHVIALLSKDFVRLVLFANLIAWPIGYFAMNRWLQDFAFRANLDWWMFALAGGMALLIALLTVSAQALKAALANPVEALRYE